MAGCAFTSTGMQMRLVASSFPGSGDGEMGGTEDGGSQNRKPAGHSSLSLYTAERRNAAPETVCGLQYGASEEGLSLLFCRGW